MCEMPRLSKGQQRGSTFRREPRLPCCDNICYGCFLLKQEILTIWEGGYSILPDHPDVSLSPALIPTGDINSPLRKKA